MVGRGSGSYPVEGQQRIVFMLILCIVKLLVHLLATAVYSLLDQYYHLGGVLHTTIFNYVLMNNY